MAARFPATNTASYLTLGTLGLPTGDWCIFFTASFPSSLINQGDAAYALLCIGNQSDTIITDNGNLLIAIGEGNLTNANGLVKQTVHVSGRDDAGVHWCNAARQFTNWMSVTGASARVQSGDAGVCDNQGRTYFVQKSGSTISVWSDPQGGSPVEISRSTTTAGAMSAKPMLCGALNRLTISNFVSRGTHIQRIGRVARALTVAEMEQITNGVDPVSLLGMSAGSGDLYWPIDNTTALAAGGSLAESVQGLTGSVTGGSWQVPTNIIPTTPRTAWSSVSVKNGQVLPLWGPNSQNAIPDFKLSATASQNFLMLDGRWASPTGSVIDVQARLIDYTTPATVYVDWQTVASGVKSGAATSGTWSGRLYGPALAKRWHYIETRLVIDGVAQPGTRCIQRVGVGITYSLLGQSLADDLRVNTSQTTVNTWGIQHMGPLLPNQLRQNTFTYGCMPSNTYVTCYGENQLTTMLGNAASTAVGSRIDAVMGTAIENWSQKTNSLYICALAGIRQDKPPVIMWNQGNGSTGLGANYYTYLDTLYKNLVEDAGYTFAFGVLPVSIEVNSGQSMSSLWSVRDAQIRWVLDQQAAGNRRVFLVGSVNEVTLSDTTHATPDASGYGRFAERYAQTILNILGLSAYSAVGASVDRAFWDGATNIDVVFGLPAGATTLKTPGAGDVTGFEVSVNGGTTWAAPASATLVPPARVRLTLATAPGQVPLVRYQNGGPGPGSGSIAAVANPLYDDRVPLLNTTLGFPALPSCSRLFGRRADVPQVIRAADVRPLEIVAMIAPGVGLHKSGTPVLVTER